LLIGLSSDDINDWISTYQQDSHYTRVLEHLNDSSTKNKFQFPQYRLDTSGLIYFEDWEGHSHLCIPDSRKLEILDEVHNSQTESAH
ncbi:hypothetical protein NEOLEDRAFT_1030489, partial [Neolentinus lepideus HHB14362 ss-1]